MKRTPPWSYEWFYYLTVGLLFLAVVLRTLLIYDAKPAVMDRDLALEAAWLAIFITEPALNRRWPVYFPLYLAIQSALVVGMLFSPDPPDYFAILFAVLSMQVLNRLSPRVAMICIAVFTPLIAASLAHTTGLFPAVAFSLVYTAANTLFGFVSLTARRANDLRLRNQATQMELQEANHSLQIYSQQMEKLATARERNHLARELHDSVTQTVFSMTLTTQSALLMLDRDPARVKSQLDHLASLAQSAMVEMQTLISELRPEAGVSPGLAEALRQHLAGRQLPEHLVVSLAEEGNGRLTPDEESCLFRIAQESLNNIVKHAQASQVCIRLNLNDPQWMEIEDNGQGFAYQQAHPQSGIGLSSMRERAAEIGWTWQIFTAPGAGTRIRVEKEASNVH